MKTIDAKTAEAWVEMGEAAIVDVREPHEYAAFHIKNATLVPLGTLTPAMLPSLNGKKLIVHCHFGKRSAMGCQLLMNADPTLDIYNLEGGIDAWIKAGLPIEN